MRGNDIAGHVSVVLTLGTLNVTLSDNRIDVGRAQRCDECLDRLRMRLDERVSWMEINDENDVRLDVGHAVRLFLCVAADSLCLVRRC